MMMRSKTAAALAALLVLCAALPVAADTAPQEAQTGGWSYPIVLSGSGEYKELQLLSDVYINAGRDLANLRIVDDTGSYVPYFLYDSTLETQQESASFPGEFEAGFTVDSNRCTDFRIDTQPNTDVYGNSLTLHTADTGFAKDVSVLGSHDGVQWTPVAQALVYRVDVGENLTIPFEETQKYSWYRVQVPNDLEQVAFNSVTLIFQGETQQRRGFTQTLTPDFKQTEDGSTTVLRVPGAQLQNLTLLRLTLETDSMFSRQVQAPGGSAALYNLTFENRALKHLELPLSARAYTADGDFEITIANNDDRPIAVDALRFVYRSERLVFRAQPGRSYALVLVDGEEKPAVYDIASYAAQVMENGVDTCTYGAGEYTAAPGAPPPEKSISDSLVFQISIAAASLLLIVLIVKNTMKRKPEKNS